MEDFIPFFETFNQTPIFHFQFSILNSHLLMLTDEQRENLLRAFYHERLLPLARLAKERGIEFFPLNGSADLESYYKDRNDDGNYVHEIDPANLAGELEKLWQDLPELAQLAEPLTALAEAIREDEETQEEISPFIYAMF